MIAREREEAHTWEAGTLETERESGGALETERSGQNYGKNDSIKTNRKACKMVLVV